jgi:phosphatidate phosphatase APP1
MSPTGTCVVSDIDDTIKDSDVGNRKQLLANTFLRDFRSIDGMAEVYRTWSESGASFHYVSSSPWQLYTSLHQMNVSHRFPAGTMHLRNFRLRDQLLKKISLRRQGKTTAIRFLMKHLPERKFILIGDSGEKDPEIYRKICRKYPGRVSALFIREIPERPLEEERLRKIAQTMPTGVVAKFSNAQELKSLAEKTF